MNTNTSTIERINLQTRKLPESFQKEVLHFVEFLVNKAKKEVGGFAAGGFGMARVLPGRSKPRY